MNLTFQLTFQLIYVLFSTLKMAWYGMDGLTGPVLSGTGYYLKRESLYGHFAQEGMSISLYNFEKDMVFSFWVLTWMQLNRC